MTGPPLSPVAPAVPAVRPPPVDPGAPCPGVPADRVGSALVPGSGAPEPDGPPGVSTGAHATVAVPDPAGPGRVLEDGWLATVLVTDAGPPPRPPLGLPSEMREVGSGLTCGRPVSRLPMTGADLPPGSGVAPAPAPGVSVVVCNASLGANAMTVPPGVSGPGARPPPLPAVGEATGAGIPAGPASGSTGVTLGAGAAAAIVGAAFSGSGIAAGAACG